MKKRKQIIAYLLSVSMLAVSLPQNAQAAAKPVKAVKSSLSLKITQKGKKTTYGTAKIKLKTAKGVRIKSTKYRVKNKKIAKVSQKGKVTARKQGKTKVTVTVKYQQKKKMQTKKITVKVNVKTVTSTVPSPVASATNQPSGTSQPVSGTSVTAGSTASPAPAGSQTVQDPSKVAQIHMVRKNYITYVGGQTGLNPQVLPETARVQTVRYESADTSIAKVNRDGVITGVREGDTTITVKSTDGSNVGETVAVKVVKDASLAQYVDDYYDAANVSVIQDATEGEEDGDSTSWSAIDSLEEQVSSRKESLIDDAIKQASDNEKGSAADQIAALYETAQDTSGREETGIGSLLDYVQEIEAAATVEDFLEVEAKLDKKGIGGIFNTQVNITDSDSKTYSLFLETSDYGISDYAFGDDFSVDGDWDDDWGDDEDWSFDDDDEYIVPDSEEALETYADSLFAAAGETQEERETHIEELKTVCKQFAVSYDDLWDKLGDLSDDMTEEEWLEALENMDFGLMKEYTPEELDTVMENCSLSEYLEAAGYDTTQNVSIAVPSQMKQIDEYLTQEHLEELKQYAKYELLNQYGTYLTKEIYDNYAALYEAENWESYTSYEDFAMKETSDTLAWEICSLYTDTYESQEKKDNISEMVNEIVEQYEKELSGCEWLSQSTKESALKKLSAICINVLYPDDYSPYLLESDLLLPEEGGSLLDNEMMIAEEYAEAERNAVGQELTGEDWIASPLDVNSYYMASLNSIYICSGIAEGLVYDESRSDAANYGSLGMIIAHEISHAFDANGCHYDENGDLNDWWTTQDKEYYTQIQQKLIDYYDTFYITSVDKQPVFQDGEMTLSENIADLAGVACVVSLVGDDKDTRKELFTGFANMWAETGTLTEDTLYSVLLDSHSVAKVRVNAVLSMLDEFYDTYDVQESDAMYVAPEERIHIWR
jgi:putative endopeptidase